MERSDSDGRNWGGPPRPGRSVAFIVDKPVKREIFAADFRDRVVHHLIINKLNPLFERELIYDSYACRAGRGTLFGVRRLQRFIRECSANYTRDAYVLTLDISGFFMHINARILFARLASFIQDRYGAADRSLLIELYRVVLFNDARDNAVIKGQRSDWDALPAGKSGVRVAAGVRFANREPDQSGVRQLLSQQLRSLRQA